MSEVVGDPEMIREMSRAFSFENPDFDSQAAVDAEAVGSVYPIPERIEFMIEREERWYIPTGLYWSIDRWAREEGVRLGLDGPWPEWITSPKATTEKGVPTVEDDLIPGITLRDYQIDAIREILTWRRGVLEIATGGGKCLGAGTEVLKYDGSVVPVEEIQTGDLLMGPDSTPRRVLSTTRGESRLYRIVPTRGRSWVCNDVHVLSLKDTVTGKVTDIPVGQYLGKSKNYRHRKKQFSVGVDFEPFENLPVDPYFLGVWLGDGAKTRKEGKLVSVRVCKPDPEIKNLMESTAGEWGAVVNDISAKDRCTEWSISTRRGVRNPLLSSLQALFPDDCTIPRRYLTASRSDRLSLLAGLLDTDGYLHNSSFELVQRRVEIATGAAFLARSLGFRVLESEKIVKGVTYQRISISGDVSVIPTRIPRKKSPPRKQKKDVLRTGFAVEDAGFGDYYGFTLDGDGRFLLGDFTVTHNTEIAIGAVLAIGGRTLYLVPDTKAMETSWKRFRARGLDAGRLGDQNRELDRPVLIAVVNSLYNGVKSQDPDILEWLEGADVYICDEAHHQGTALSWKMVSANVQAEYRICLSGTPFKEDKVRMDPSVLDPYDSWLIGLSGRVLYYLPPKELIRRGALSPGVFASWPAARTEKSITKVEWWPEVYRLGIAENAGRNAQVCQLASNLSSMGRKPLISIEKLEHGRDLQRRLLREHRVPAACSYGSGVLYLPIEVAEAAGAVCNPAPITQRKRRRVKGKMKWVTETVGEEPDICMVVGVDVDQLLLQGDVKVLIGSKIFDEAQDIPWLTDMINAAGGKASQRLRQKIGRILRLHPGKQVAWFWDPWDESHYYLKAHSKKRLQIAQDEGYPTITDWTLAKVLTWYDLPSLRIGEVSMKLREMEVKVELTVPMALPGNERFVYVKPAVTLRADLDEGDDPTVVEQQLHNRAMALFLLEAHRQAAECAQIATRPDGFAYAEARARQYLSMFEPPAEQQEGA